MAKKNSSLDLSWPYSIQSESISLKTLFLNSTVSQYLSSRKISVCRVLFYENDLLRYFSKEMVIVRDCFFIKKLKCES